MLILIVGFLAGMIPAMLLIGYLGGRQVEKQRKELKLQYERQITALRSTIRRLMQRIDLLSSERSNLKRSNRSLREALRDHHRYTDETSAELLQIREELDRVSAENLRHEGRLQQARLHQEQMKDQYSQTVAQFTEAERLRRHLLFATKQLRGTQATQKMSHSQEQEFSTTPLAELDVAILESIEPRYVERLHDSGIHTISDLVQQTPDRVAHFAGLSNWDESTQWIAEANAILEASPNNGV